MPNSYLRSRHILLRSRHILAMVQSSVCLSAHSRRAICLGPRCIMMIIDQFTRRDPKKRWHLHDMLYNLYKSSMGGGDQIRSHPVCSPLLIAKGSTHKLPWLFTPRSQIGGALPLAGRVGRRSGADRAPRAWVDVGTPK